jgi:hypothetical protein
MRLLSVLLDPIGMVPSPRLDQDALLAILERQIAVITRQQALAAGVTRHALRHRLRVGGPWHRLLPGICVAATGRPTSLQREMACSTRAVAM